MHHVFIGATAVDAISTRGILNGAVLGKRAPVIYWIYVSARKCADRTGKSFPLSPASQESLGAACAEVNRRSSFPRSKHVVSHAFSRS